MSGVLGESALFSLDLSHIKNVTEIEWTFSNGIGNKILVAELNPGGFQRPNPQDRFGDRLEINETMLRIRELQWGDNGLYQARIKLIGPEALVEDRSFNLSLYGGCRWSRSPRSRRSHSPGPECGFRIPSGPSRADPTLPDREFAGAGNRGTEIAPVPGNFLRF